MSKDKFFDFDAFMEEKKSTEKPFIVRAFGEDHEIPAALPYDVVLEITRAKKDGQEEVNTDQLQRMCYTIFGEDTFNKWIAKGISLDGVLVLTEKVVESYMAEAAGTSQTMAKQKRESLPKP